MRAGICEEDPLKDQNEDLSDLTTTKFHLRIKNLKSLLYFLLIDVIFIKASIRGQLNINSYLQWQLLHVIFLNCW